MTALIEILLEIGSAYEIKIINQVGEVSAKFTLNIKKKPDFFKQPDDAKIIGANNDDGDLCEIVATNKSGEAKCLSKILVEFAPFVVKDLKTKEKSVEKN